MTVVAACSDLPDADTLAQPAERSLTLVARKFYSPSRFESDERDLGAPVAFALPDSIPVTIGNAGNHWVHLRHRLGENLATCCYRGGAAQPHPNSPAQAALGEQYNFSRCYEGAIDCVAPPASAPVLAATPGTVILADWVRLTVLNGDSYRPSRSAAQTEVRATLITQAADSDGGIAMEMCGDLGQPGEPLSFAAAGDAVAALGIARWAVQAQSAPDGRRATLALVGLSAARQPVLVGAIAYDVAGVAALPSDAPDALLATHAPKRQWIRVDGGPALDAAVEASLWTAVSEASPTRTCLDERAARSVVRPSTIAASSGPDATCRFQSEGLLRESIGTLREVSAALGSRNPAAATRALLGPFVAAHRDFNCCSGLTDAVRSNGPSCGCAARFVGRPVLRIDTSPAERSGDWRDVEYLCEPCPAGTAWNGTACTPPRPPAPDDDGDGFAPNDTGRGGGACLYDVYVNAAYAMNAAFGPSGIRIAQARGPILGLRRIDQRTDYYSACNCFAGGDICTRSFTNYDVGIVTGSPDAPVATASSWRVPGGDRETGSLNFSSTCETGPECETGVYSCRPELLGYGIVDVRPAADNADPDCIDSAPPPYEPPPDGPTCPDGGPPLDPTTGDCGCPASGPPFDGRACACPEGSTWDAALQECVNPAYCLGAIGNDCTPLQADPSLAVPFAGLPACGAEHRGPAGELGGVRTCVSDPHWSAFDGLQYQQVGVGSLRHDDCCRLHPEGLFCGGSNAQPASCATEFALAVRDSVTAGRTWRVLFDPATPAGARAIFEPDGALTTYGLQLRAPFGARMQPVDATYCESGEVGLGADGETVCAPHRDELPAVHSPPVVEPSSVSPELGPGPDCERFTGTWEELDFFVTRHSSYVRDVNGRYGTTYGSMASYFGRRVLSDGSYTVWVLRDGRARVQAAATLVPRGYDPLDDAPELESGREIEALASAARGYGPKLVDCVLRAYASENDLPVVAIPASQAVDWWAEQAARINADDTIPVIGRLEDDAWIFEAPVDLRVDNNRNGVIDLGADALGRAEDDGEDTWSDGSSRLAHGAIVLANIDDDSARCAGIDPSDARFTTCNDAEDDVINGPSDLRDLAPMVMRPWAAAADDCRGTLEIQLRGTVGFSPRAPASRVRIFKRRIGAVSFTTADATTLSADDLRQGVEFAIEARDVVREARDWDGRIDIQLTVTQGDRVVGTDRVQLRVAPILVPHHLVAPLEVYHADMTSMGNPYAQFLADLDEFVGRASIGATPIRRTIAETHGNPWTQDAFEAASMTVPAADGGVHGMHVFLRSPQSDGIDFRLRSRVVFEQFRGPDVAAVQTLGPGSRFDVNGLGNLEVIPPHTAPDGRNYPNGRVLVGAWTSADSAVGGHASEPFDPAFLALLDAQRQPPLVVRTGWLEVGHVDEFVSFVPSSRPGNRHGFALVVADADLAWGELERVRDEGNGSAELLSGFGPNLRRTVDQILGDGVIEIENAAAGEIITRIVSQLQSEIGLDDADIIRVPVLWAALGNELYSGAGSGAVTPSIPNGLSLGSHFGAPRPFGPIVGGRDRFEVLAERAFAPHGVTVHWIDVLSSYHTLQGDVHCATNTRRALPTDAASAWWQPRDR